MAGKSNGNGNGNFYWPIIVGVFLAIVQAFWGLAYSSLQGENARLTTEIKDRLTLREYEEYKSSARRDIETIKAGFQEHQRDMGNRVAAVTKLEALEKRVDIQFLRVEEIAKNINSVVTPAKAIDDLKRDIETLRAAITAQMRRPETPTVR